MGAHGSILVNVVNAKVADRRAVEAQCHNRFRADRVNGEWFKTSLEEITTYIHAEVEWQEIDFENMARMAQYIVACQAGDLKQAKHALFGPDTALSCP
jgi:hypothetical protein